MRSSLSIYLEKYRKLITLLLFLIITIVYSYIGIKYVWYATLWGPYDELPHVDYIDRVAFEKRLPKDGELISDRTHRLHLDVEAVNGPGYDGTKAGLGPIGYSYEAHQPPLYYLVMALPYKWIMSQHWTATKQARSIRMVSYLLHLLGTFMIIPVFVQLRKLFPGKLDISFGFILMTLVWLTSTNLRFGIGNDHLSMLVVHSSLFFLILAWRKKRFSDIFLALLFAAMAFFTKHTNLLASGTVFLLALILWYKRIPRPKKRVYLLSFLPILLIPVYFAWMIQLNGFENMMGNQHTKSLFGLITAGLFNYKTFLELMSIDFFSFYYLMIFYKKKFLIFCICFLFGYISYLVYLRSNWGERPYWTIAIATVTLLFLALYFLNKHVCCIVWFSFRLYSGYMIFIWFTIAGLFSINKKWIRYVNVIVLMALLYPGLKYLIEWG